MQLAMFADSDLSVFALLYPVTRSSVSHTWQVRTTLCPKSAVTLLMHPEKDGGESTHVL